MMKRSLLFAASVANVNGKFDELIITPMYKKYSDEECKNEVEGDAPYTHRGGSVPHLGGDICMPATTIFAKSCNDELFKLQVGNSQNLYDPLGYREDSMTWNLKYTGKNPMQAPQQQKNDEETQIREKETQRREGFNAANTCFAKKVCDGAKENPCAEFWSDYRNAFDNHHVENDWSTVAASCYEKPGGDYFNYWEDLPSGSCVERSKLSDDLFLKYKAELSARYENLFYAADLFAKCVSIPIVCDGENAELTQLLAEKKARDDIVAQREKDFFDFQLNRHTTLQEAEKQGCMDICPATNTEEKKCEFGYDGKCEFECQAFSGHPKNCVYDQGANEFGDSLCEKIFRTLDDGTSESTMLCPLKEESQFDKACCDVDPWGDFDKDPMMQDLCIRYTHERLDRFIYGDRGIQQWKCIELIDPNDVEEIGNFEDAEEAALEEARENEKKITYNAEEAKDLKGSDYGRTWSCSTVTYPNGYPAGVSHPYFGKTLQSSLDVCAGSAEQLCFDNSLSEDDACYAPIKIEDDGSFAEKYGEVEAPDGCPACVCPSGAGLLRMSEEDGDSSSDASATTIAAAAPIVMALLA